MKTDAQVKHDVTVALQWEPSVNAGQVSIFVNSGRVTLAGHVSSYSEKWDAERVTQRIAGVKAVTSEIDVQLPSASARSDSDIALSVNKALQWMHYLPKDSIKVHVDNGWVMLFGEVEWEFQKQAIRGAVRFLVGIKGVIDHLSITPMVSMAKIKSTDRVASDAVAWRRQFDTKQVPRTLQSAGTNYAVSFEDWPEPRLADHAFFVNTNDGSALADDSSRAL
ncbi:hypothetical protein BH11PSE12_BH11PSE12_28610 [soil metagenome]